MRCRSRLIMRSSSARSVMRVSSATPSPWAKVAPKVSIDASSVSSSRFMQRRGYHLPAFQQSQEARMNQPWLDHYDEGVPRAIAKYPDKTLVDFVCDHSRDRGDDVALKFKGR